MQDTTTELNVTTTEMMDVDCEVSSWKAGGSCTVTCGGGVQQLYRDVSMPFDSRASPFVLRLKWSKLEMVRSAHICMKQPPAAVMNVRVLLVFTSDNKIL